MTSLVFLLPLLPFVWAHETSFAVDIALIPATALVLLAWKRPRRWTGLGIVYSYLLLFHAGILRTTGPGAALGTWIGILGALLVAALVFSDEKDRRVLRESPAYSLACLIAVFVALALGVGIHRSTEGALSRLSVSVIGFFLVPVLALALFPTATAKSSTVRKVLLPAMAILCLLGIGRGAYQAIHLRSLTRATEALVANGQYGQSLEKSLTALQLAQKKSWRPAERYLHFKRFEAYKGLGQPVDAIHEAKLAGELDPFRWNEIAAAIEDTFITQLSKVSLEQKTFANLAVDVEVSRDGQDVYVLDRLGRVYLAREEGYTQVYDPQLKHRDAGTYAVDLELSDNGAGYLVLDSRGGIHVGGDPSRALKQVLDSGKLPRDWTIDMEISPDETVLYVLTRYGIVRALGTTPFNNTDLRKHHWDADSARDLEIASNGSLVILDKFGATHWIGEPMPYSTLPGVPYWQDQDMAVDFEVWPDDRSWGVLDRFGAIHAVGPVQYVKEEADTYYRSFPCAIDMEIVPTTGGVVFVDGNFGIHRAHHLDQ